METRQEVRLTDRRDRRTPNLRALRTYSDSHSESRLLERDERMHKMKIGELTSRSMVETDIHESLMSAAVQLASNEVGALIVYDSDGPAGIFSERDLLQAVADGTDLEGTRVRDYMTVSPVRIESESSLDEGIEKMSNLGVRHLIVVENDEIVGMVSARDVLRALNRRHSRGLVGSL
jgi:signal-transduction protein with cAMP-binding, CBS, and nucleotidyltransferase domain